MFWQLIYTHLDCDCIWKHSQHFLIIFYLFQGISIDGLISLNSIVDYPNYGEMYAPYPRSTFNPSTGRAYFHNVQFTQENSYVIDFKAITVPDPTYGFVTLSTPIKSFKVCGASDLDKFEDRKSVV